MTKETVSKYKSVVFAGGGSRCFWQLGFWSVAAPDLNLRPSVVAGTSAGAPFACFSLYGDAEDILRYFKEKTRENRKNLYIENIIRKKPLFPHLDMFRDAIYYVLNDRIMEQIQNGPDIRVLITRPPRWMGARLAATIAVAVYNIEKHIFHPMHPVFSSKIGFKGEVVSLKECSTIDEVANLFLETSCAPPLLPVMKRDNRIVLDGGIIDNVPVRIIEDCAGEKLVLLTRSYKEEGIPKVDGITYVQPSERIPITKWEYTDPDGLQYVYDLGRRDGENFIRKERTA